MKKFLIKLINSHTGKSTYFSSVHLEACFATGYTGYTFFETKEDAENFMKTHHARIQSFTSADFFSVEEVNVII